MQLSLCWLLLMLKSHLQNSSTDVSVASLTFHPILGVVICFTVWHSVPTTQGTEKMEVKCTVYCNLSRETEYEKKSCKVRHLSRHCSFPLPTHSLADILSSKDHVAGLTSEAADVPLFLQRQKRLPLLDLSSTSSTVWRGGMCERQKEDA